MNTQIRRLAAGLLVCFLALFVQLNILQVGAKQEQLNADPRNTREAQKDFNRPRGPIVSADGVILAESVPADDGYAYQRVYPTGDLFANITGYYSYAYGATQLEKTENDALVGKGLGSLIANLPNLLGGPTDLSGSVHVTLRSDLQQLAKDQLAGREGSVVVLDPRRGAVLAMYSAPSYDPNLVADHRTASAGQWLTFLNAQPDKPLLANAYQERYMPGSTFKVVTTAIALEDGAVTLDSQFANERSYTPPQTVNPIRNYHGELCGGTFPQVFARSCNTPFARLAVDLGPSKMVAGAERFGIGEAPPFDLPRPASSYFGTVSELTDNLPLLAMRGFGQNEDAITPLQMAMIAATVANGGKMMQPYVVDATYDHDGRVLERTSPKVWKTPMLPETAATLTELMIGVVQSGTARSTMQLANGVQAAAKTGTAQLNPDGQPERSHAWIVAFAPAEAPRLAVAVFLKGVNDEISAGTGGRLAGPIAKQMLDFGLSVYAE